MHHMANSPLFRQAAFVSSISEWLYCEKGVVLSFPVRPKKFLES